MQFVPKTTPTRPDLTRSLHRAVGLLRLLASHTRIGWRLSDLAKHAELDPATVHRLLTGLCDAGLATRVQGSKHYTLGPLAFELGLAATPYFDLGRLAHARLAALATELKGTIFLKIRSGVESVCLARHDGAGPVPSLMLDVGGRRPLCLTAGGVAMLLPLPPAEQKRIEAANQHTIERQDRTRWTGISQMLVRSRQLGFALNLGDIATGISAVSVAITTDGQAPAASVTLALTGTALTESTAPDLAARLRLEASAMGPMLAQLRL
jgi:DNA-binding IclR family transcriptional regulator